MIASDGDSLVASLALETGTRGIHTVLVRDDRVMGGNDTGSGAYTILFTSDAPPAVPLPPWSVPLMFAAIALVARRARLA